MKTLIHSKVPVDCDGSILISPEFVSRWAKNTKDQLGDNYVLIVSPFETNKIDGDASLINIDLKEYSYNELMNIIEKANMYDGLCK